MTFEPHNPNELPPLPPVPSNGPQRAKSGNWFLRHKVVSGGLAGIVGLVVLAGIFGGDDKEVASQASGSDTQSAPAATEAPSAGPIATEPTPEPTPEPAADADTVNFAMPNFIGMNLQDAQDKVQTYGVFFSDSHDLNGSRMQILDSNWKVCTQNIKPGTKMKGAAVDYEGKIDFGAVKIAEDCP